jgi:hypothetical protein
MLYQPDSLTHLEKKDPHPAAEISSNAWLRRSGSDSKWRGERDGDEAETGGGETDSFGMNGRSQREGGADRRDGHHDPRPGSGAGHR